MPTVTVLAWCLMASIGTRQLLDAPGQRERQIVDDDRRRADLAVLDLVGVERADAEAVAQQRRQPHGSRRFEVTVVGAGAQAVEETRAGGLERGPHAPQQLVAVGAERRRRVKTPPSRSRRALRAAATPGSRWPARLRSRTGGRRCRQARTRATGCVLGTLIACTAAEKRSSPSVAMTIGVALCARKIATSLATSSAVEPVSPAAQTRMSGSDDRSMCFLSSVESQAIDL